MGLIRTLLAMSVLVAHTNVYDNLLFVGARNAVQIFYIISGFLISYILFEKKSYNKIINFYQNRILRLFPIYFIIFIITFAWYINFNTKFFDYWTNLGSTEKIFSIVSNVFIIFQDYFHFIPLEKGIININSSSKEMLSQSILVSQSWTLALEIAFYLIAPFVLKNKKILFLLFFLSITVRLLLFKIGIATELNWSYMFFPAELSLFLLGALSHQILTPIYKNYKYLFTKKNEVILIFFLVVIFVLFPFIQINSHIKTFMLFLIIFLSLPFMFTFQNNFKLDKSIGDLSYPIYMNHVIIIQILRHNFNLDPLSFILITIISSIIFALILNNFLQIYFDRIRYKNRLSKN